MEEIKLGDDVIEQIKDFDHDYLPKKQKLLIDKLILNKESKVRYIGYGLCKECKQPFTNYYWCQSCNAKHFQENFKNWTSGNSDVDKLIQESQLNAKNADEKLEWIEYDRLKNIEYVTKGGFGTIYKAIWKDGMIYRWDCETKRSTYTNEVALKSLNNSKDITLEFLNEVIIF